MTSASPDPGDPVARLGDCLRAALADVAPARRRVAVSGGRDSLLLMTLLARLHLADGMPPPPVVHVHHGLHPAADDWAARVCRQAAALGCPVEVVRVEVGAGGEGPEAAARTARLAAFAELLGADEHLLTAHHRDDQAETVLLRLMRGAGPRGLAGMRRRRRLGAGWLTRPLLDIDGADIEAAALALGLDWIEDPANADRSLDRNLLRHEILPRLRARWPAAGSSLARAARACADQESLLDALLEPVPEAGAPLPLAGLEDRGPAAHARLRRWLDGAGLPMPPRARLDTLLGQLDASADARVRVDLGPAGTAAGVSVRRFGAHLHLVPMARPTPRPAAPLAPGCTELGCGRLRLEATVGEGLRADLGPPTVAFRTGGERLQPPGRGGTVALKQWLQEQGVPPWERERLPLLCLDGRIAAVADRLVCAGFGAGAGVPGWRIHWQPTDG